MELVDRVLARLALESCRDTCIGSVLSRGISGGEVRGKQSSLEICSWEGS